MTFGKYFERRIEWWWSHVAATISLEVIAILKTGIKLFIHFTTRRKKKALFYNCEFNNIFEENLSKIGIILLNMVISGWSTFYFQLKHEVGMASTHK